MVCASTGELDSEPGGNGWRRSESRRRRRRGYGWGLLRQLKRLPWLMMKAARRLYGPEEAYLNLPHFRSNINPLINKSSQQQQHNKLMNSQLGLLNLSSQPNVHVIHQRLQELMKKTEAISRCSLHAKKEEEPAADYCSSSSAGEKVVNREEKPEIDLNEFLQQLGILEKEEEEEYINKSSDYLSNYDYCFFPEAEPSFADDDDKTSYY